jgi:nitrate reductase NapE component
MATEVRPNRARSHASTWTPLGLLLFLCVTVVVFPVIIMRPFVGQAALPLTLALFLQRWAPWITIVGFLSGLMLGARSWAHRGERFAILKNVLLVAAVASLGLCAWASRLNVYEMRFQPPGSVQLVPVAQAIVRPDDMVLVVRINGDNRAYPILQMAYHHVVNDVVGGVPIVSTY